MTIHSHARRLADALPDTVRTDLCGGPLSAIPRYFPLTVAVASSFDEPGEHGWCDGASITDAGVILYRPTDSRRENFTLLHELAHHLIANDDDCPSWLADQDDPGKLEEEICNLVAARLLIPEERITQALDKKPPSAATVTALYQATGASRSACAIAVAQRIPCDGFVILTEPGSGEVFVSSRTRDTRPYPWKGDPIPDPHPLSRPDPPPKAKTWWPRWNGDRRDFYMVTGDVAGYICGVFAENDLWGIDTLHVYTPVEEDRGYHGTLTCPCGYQGVVRMYPCRTCGVSECPRCGECDCQRRERNQPRDTCANCFSSVRSHLLVDGLCDACR